MVLVKSTYTFVMNSDWNPDDPNSSAGIGYKSVLWADLGPIPTLSDFVSSMNAYKGSFGVIGTQNVSWVSAPQKTLPRKAWSAVVNYFGFLGCELNSFSETITDEEDVGSKTAFGFMNAGALWAIRFKQANLFGFTFVATAGAMDIGAMAKANQECTPLFYP